MPTALQSTGAPLRPSTGVGEEHVARSVAQPMGTSTTVIPCWIDDERHSSTGMQSLIEASAAMVQQCRRSLPRSDPQRSRKGIEDERWFHLNALAVDVNGARSVESTRNAEAVHACKPCGVWRGVA
jgi:hypothetical protein